MVCFATARNSIFYNNDLVSFDVLSCKQSVVVKGLWSACLIDMDVCEAFFYFYRAFYMDVNCGTLVERSLCNSESIGCPSRCLGSLIFSSWTVAYIKCVIIKNTLHRPNV